MMVRFCTTCDECGARSEEYTAHPTCRDCGRDICALCQVPNSTTDADLDAPKTCRCLACAFAEMHDMAQFVATVVGRAVVTIKEGL